MESSHGNIIFGNYFESNLKPCLLSSQVGIKDRKMEAGAGLRLPMASPSWWIQFLLKLQFKSNFSRPFAQLPRPMSSLLF